MAQVHAHGIEHRRSRAARRRTAPVPSNRSADAPRRFEDAPVAAEGPSRARCDQPAASFLFAAGLRPSADQLRALAAADPTFEISFAPEAGEPWLEVLANGLAFDIRGLAPGAPQPLSPGTHRYGLPPDLDLAGMEAISLRPAPSIAACAHMIPVVRSLAWLAAALARLPGMGAVCWHSARALSSPAHFRSSIMRWMEGGVFPGLGLTALAPTDEGGLESEGLALFTGQELRLSPELAHDRAAGARLALRLVHWLAENDRIDTTVGLPGPAGAPLVLEPSGNRRLVTASLG